VSQQQQQQQLQQKQEQEQQQQLVYQPFQAAAKTNIVGIDSAAVSLSSTEAAGVILAVELNKQLHRGHLKVHKA
jgi:hypothetical protein